MLGGKELFERGTFAQKEEVEDENKFPCIKINYSKCVSVRRRSLKWCNKNALNTRWSRISEEHLSCKSKFPAGWHCTKCLWSKQLKSQFAILDSVSNGIVWVRPLKIPEFMLEINPKLEWSISRYIQSPTHFFLCKFIIFVDSSCLIAKNVLFRERKKLFFFGTQRNQWIWENYDGNQKLKDFENVACNLLILPTN